MDILTLLEHLADCTHYHSAVDELMNSQPNEIKTAFLTNNAAQLRNQLGDTNNLADRSSVVQITF